MSEETKQYLGECVYAEQAGITILLTTKLDGKVINKIYLWPETFQKLEAFAEKIGWRPE